MNDVLVVANPKALKDLQGGENRGEDEAGEGGELGETRSPGHKVVRETHGTWRMQSLASFSL